MMHNVLHLGIILFVLISNHPSLLHHPAVPLSAGVQVVQHDVVDQSVSINAPEKVQVGPESKIHLMVHTWDNVGEATDSVEDILDNNDDDIDTLIPCLTLGMAK